MRGQTDRAQAYTLEGFIGAMILLLAVLFALQAVVITPTTGGLADRTVQAQLQQESQDALSVASQDGNLSETVRNWNTSQEKFHNATEPSSPGQEVQTYTPGEFANQSRLGQLLQDRYTNDGWNYNVELVYENEDGDGFNSTHLVYQGSPPSDAFTASHVVTLYEDDTVTAGDGSSLEDAYDNHEYPIPPAETDSEYLYTLVEVRVILW
ncbi:DUF7288 family protein [Halosolutus halophilus]|uniref:DUF7288 family protein n=1 Tax=Halosolutus halophilus TaxID=1552990 RepID=UPI00223511D9|nr:hypothetical protein [Halosolutus halophilus]